MKIHRQGRNIATVVELHDYRSKACSFGSKDSRCLARAAAVAALVVLLPNVSHNTVGYGINRMHESVKSIRYQIKVLSICLPFHITN